MFICTVEPMHVHADTRTEAMMCAALGCSDTHSLTVNLGQAFLHQDPVDEHVNVSRGVIQHHREDIHD